MMSNNTVFSHNPIVSWYMVIQGEVNFLFSTLHLRRLYVLGSACEIFNANYKISQMEHIHESKEFVYIL